MISVILPVRNGAEFLDEAITSVLRQSYEDFELIVVDDGSSDGSPAIVEAAGRRDSRVRLLRRHPGGISRALNAGIAASQGEWIARMDADDIAWPERLERQLAAAAACPEVVLWGSWVELFVDRPKGRRLVAEIGPATLEDFLRRRDHGPPVAFIHPTVLIRREALDAAGGYDPRFDGAEDVELFDRVAQIGPMLVVPEVLLSYRMRPSSATLVRYATGWEVTRYLDARIAARARGEAAPSWEEFQAGATTGRWTLRPLQELRRRGEWLATHADIAYLSRRPMRALALKLAAAVVDPAILRRLVRRTATHRPTRPRSR